MARGWESKSVEEQIEAAHERASGVRRPRLSVEQVETERKRDGLLLQRTRVLRDLSGCTNDRYRITLASGLAYLEEQLAELGWKQPEG
jgi:hypothetical protein